MNMQCLLSYIQKQKPLASTGGAAKIIYDKYFDGKEPELCINLAYSSLFKDLLNL